MKKNYGKIFEESFKKSVPDSCLYYRLPDAAQSFGGSNKLRFSIKNPFDCILYAPFLGVLYALELKTVKGKSITFEIDKNDKKEIHLHQIEGLNKWAKYDGICAGFVIEFRELEKTVFLPIESFNKLVCIVGKKSFNFADIENSSLPYSIIEQTKLRTRYIYNIEKFLKESEEKHD